LLLTVHFNPGYDIPYLQSNVDCLVVSEHRLRVQVVWPPMYETLPPEARAIFKDRPYRAGIFIPPFSVGPLIELTLLGML
jgi:hypothetical protein